MFRLLLGNGSNELPLGIKPEMQIKAAVVGCGRIGSLLEEDSLREKPCTHAGAIAADPDCVLIAGCDIDEERRDLFAEKWQVPVYASAVEMIKKHSPQILCVATHPDSHYYYCRLAAEMGVKVIICEKPLADTIRQARKIARLAKQGIWGNAPVIITNHERRYSIDYIKAREILNSQSGSFAEDRSLSEGGRLGRLLSVRATLYMGKARRLLDVLWHDGTHLADAIMFLTGSVIKHRRRWGSRLNSRSGTAWLEGELRRNPDNPIEPSNPLDYSAPEENSDTLDHSDPAPIPVLIEIGAGRDHLIFEIEFSCEKGRLRIGNGIYEVWESLPSPYAEKFRSLKNTGESFGGPTGYFANMVKEAVACCRESNRQPLSGAADGLRVIEYLNSVKAWK